MNSFRWFLRRHFFTVAALLAFAVLFRGTPLAAQSNTNYNDDGYFYVYTSIYISGTSISAYASDPQPDFFETWGSYEVLGEPLWSLDGGNYSDSGNGYSFSSGPVPLGNTYSANFYFYVEYFGQAAYSGEGPLECVPGQLGDGDTCNGYDYPVGYVSLDVPYPPPVISNLSKYSVNQGDQGTLTITGSNFIEDGSDQLVLHFSGPSNPFTLNSTPSQCTSSCTATFSYQVSGYPTGTYNLWLENNEAQSEPVSFTVDPNANFSSAPPVNPCAVTSSPQVNFTSIIPTAATGGSGTMNVSFSGATFATIPPMPSVAYGPYSTPSSIAASVAARVTRYYFQYGLSARAFGPNVIYNGNASLGTVNSVISGNGGAPSAFTTSTSTGAAATTESACGDAPQTMAPATEVTVVGWIDKDRIILPPGEGVSIDVAFPSTGLPTFDPVLAATNPSMAALWAGCYAQLSVLAAGKPGVAFTASDKAYASAWLLKFSGNDDPGPTINPVDFRGKVEKFRIFNSFAPGQTVPNTEVGNTLDPCGHASSAAGEKSLYDGNIGTSTHNYRYQLAEVRVDQAGQNGYRALNMKSIPYVWSVIEFDQNGQPVREQNNDPTSTYPTTNYQIFPTYSVYENGHRVYVVHQGTPAAFANLPTGLQLLPTSIQ